ncbi:MAG: N-6 DNA methylase [Bacteroidia bacterium]|nr:N-6 DNA methylase [Bacteroidia bacterium]
MEKTTIQNKKNKYGQYFTPKLVADFMIDLADIPKDAKILEPSCGKGVFLELLQQRGYKDIIAYEIETTLANKISFVKYESFVNANINEKFDLIIGNPPYIRWKNLEDELKNELLNNHLWSKYFNSLCDYLYIFILKSIELLNENGRLIFICPEYWLNTTHSISLRNYMVSNGYFEKIYHFNETPIFDKVTVSIIIFKYIKSKQNKQNIEVSKYYANQKLTRETLYNLKNKIQTDNIEHLTISQFKTNERWLLCTDEIKEELKIIETKCKKTTIKNSLFPEDNQIEYYTIGDFCDIGNGLVSGLDKAFQLDGHKLNENEKNATIHVVKAKDIKPFYYEYITKYIFISENSSEDVIKQKYPSFYKHLQSFKTELEKRYQYNKVIPYWQWVFPRSFNLFSRNEKRIFVPCKERISNKNYFRFTLVENGIYPTQDVTAIFRKETTKESIEYILCLLNNYRTFDWLKINGIVKGNIIEFSEKPITSIPFRTIDWKNEKEIEIHNQITETCKVLIQTKNNDLITVINNFIDKLFE